METKLTVYDANSIVKFVTELLPNVKTNYTSVLTEASETLRSVTSILLDYLLTDLFDIIIDDYFYKPKIASTIIDRYFNVPPIKDWSLLETLINTFNPVLFQTASRQKTFELYCLVAEFIAHCRYRINGSFSHYQMADFLGFARRLIPSNPNYDRQLAYGYVKWKRNHPKAQLPLLFFYRKITRAQNLSEFPIIAKIADSLAVITS